MKKNELVKAKELIKLVFQHAEASMLWRRLINLFKRYPKQLKNEAFGLLMNIPIFICNETVHEAGELIKELWPTLSASQKKRLEQVILSIASSSLLQRDNDLGERRILRLISCIPSKELTSKVAITIIEEAGLHENSPILSRPTLMPHHSTRDEKISKLGIDSTDKIELGLYDLIEMLEPFNSKYEYNNKGKPPKKEITTLLPTVKKLFEINKTHSFSNSKLKFNCDFEASRFVKLLSRHGRNLSKSSSDFAYEVAIYYFNDKNYKTAYEKGDVRSRGGSFNPSPRTAAAQTFIHLLLSDKSALVAPLVLNLVGDNTQIIRFKSQNAFTYFWHSYRKEFWDKVYERALIEKDGMCLHEIINNLCYVNIMKENLKEVEGVAEILMKNLTDEDDETAYEIWHIYVVLILKLIIKHNSKVALNTVYSNLHIKAFSRGLLFEISQILDPNKIDNNYIKRPDQHNVLFEIMYAIIAFRFKSIKQKGLQGTGINDDFFVIDYSIQHLYFNAVDSRKENKGKTITSDNKAAFFSKLKPFLTFVKDESANIGSGFMVAHTGYYFMQLLNFMLDVDPEYILSLSSSIVTFAAANGFTYDQSTLGEIVKFTEKILADHKEILSKKENFDSLITILDLFANSGWQQALELTWRLKEVF